MMMILAKMVLLYVSLHFGLVQGTNLARGRHVDAIQIAIPIVALVVFLYLCGVFN